MRAGTAFLATLGLLLGLGVGADAVVTSDAETRASARVGEVLGVPADVTMRGWPVGLRLLAGRVPEVRVVASGVPAPPVAVDRLDARLRQVRLHLADLDGPGPLELRAEGGGTLVAELNAATVARLAGLDSLSFDRGIATARIRGATVELAAVVEGGSVVLRPIGSAPEGAGPVEVPVPSLPGAPTLDEVRITDDALRLTGRITRLRSP